MGSDDVTAKASAAFQALAEIFANVKGPGPYREAAIAALFDSGRTASCRRIIKLP